MGAQDVIKLGYFGLELADATVLTKGQSRSPILGAIIRLEDPGYLLTSPVVPAQCLAAQEERCTSSSAGDNGRTSRNPGSCRNGASRENRLGMFSGAMGRRRYVPRVVFEFAWM